MPHFNEFSWLILSMELLISLFIFIIVLNFSYSAANKSFTYKSKLSYFLMI